MNRRWLNIVLFVVLIALPLIAVFWKLIEVNAR